MRVVLLCALGMSTSLLVERMKEAADRKEIMADIEAHSVDSFEQQLKTADVILLGPQIRYKKSQFSSKAESVDVPLDVIDMTAYGSINGEKVLKQALDLNKKKP